MTSISDLLAVYDLFAEKRSKEEQMNLTIQTITDDLEASELSCYRLLEPDIKADTSLTLTTEQGERIVDALKNQGDTVLAMRYRALTTKLNTFALLVKGKRSKNNTPQDLLQKKLRAVGKRLDAYISKCEEKEYKEIKEIIQCK